MTGFAYPFHLRGELRPRLANREFRGRLITGKHVRCHFTAHVLTDLHILSTKLLTDVFRAVHRIDCFAAGEYVQRGISELGPRVNGQMRLRNDDDAADSLWTELVKSYFPNLCPGCQSRAYHNVLNFADVIEDVWIASVDLGKHVTAQSVHSIISPLFAVRPRMRGMQIEAKYNRAKKVVKNRIFACLLAFLRQFRRTEPAAFVRVRYAVSFALIGQKNSRNARCRGCLSRLPGLTLSFSHQARPA